MNLQERVSGRKQGRWSKAAKPKGSLDKRSCWLVPISLKAAELLAFWFSRLHRDCVRPPNLILLANSNEPVRKLLWLVRSARHRVQILRNPTLTCALPCVVGPMKWIRQQYQTWGRTPRCYRL